jgi:hypothetical protein
VDIKLIPTDVLDYGNAHYLALASALTYETDDVELRKQYAGQLSLTAQPFVAAEHLSVVLGINDRDLVLAFRGTESPLTVDGRKDWLLTNARQRLVEPPKDDFGDDFAAAGADALFHSGFLEATASLWPQFFPAFDKASKDKERLVWVTGHSLGGALAVLAAWRLRRQGVDIQKVYTFGQPMVCNLEAVNKFNLRLVNRIYRFVNEDDLIPQLPISNLIHNDYAHVGIKELLPAEREDDPAAESVLDRLRELASTLLASLPAGTVTTLLWREFEMRQRAHSIDKGYISRIVEHRQALGPA